MTNKIFKYLVPVYIVWFIAQIIFFFSFVFSQIGKETMDLSLMGLLLLSHFLVIISGIAFTIYMLVDCALRKLKKDSQKVMWVIIIYLFNVFGAIIYYYIHGKNPR
ncbi:PLDc_N domain-containing protein [Candidatus Woesearchaeota archaeon]|nr:PLDc_N domain-containing protein [Candidatus Woesearchaeota archaeon]